MEALFTSLVGGDAIRRRILELIAEAVALAVDHKVDLHVMTFSFTDEEVAQAFADAAIRCPSLTIRILADWNQRLRVRGQQVGGLTAMNLPNLRVRYSNDQPYVWDAEIQHMRWSYHASRGLLHHKTLAILVDGRPWRLICGSFNWTAAAARSYENLLVLTSDETKWLPIMSRMELEFEALWSDGRTSLSPHEAHLHHQAILDEYRLNPAISPGAIRGLIHGAGEHLQALDAECYPPHHEFQRLPVHDRSSSTDLPVDLDIAIAFACRGIDTDRGQGGHAERNRAQRLCLRTPSGGRKRVPLTITNLALETIFRAEPGNTLKVAMYAMSPRVPEYGALLDAARRGVRVFVLLNRLAGSDTPSRLNAAGLLQSLPIEVRTAGKMMHQKYLIHVEADAVVTGTANMSTDASSRHFEHRIRIGGCKSLAARFCADFDQIWARLSVYPVPAGVS
jgi:phosphatidylserine/phosphatidylglycerophosphate/cardiolipin synthase-like enzyme